MRQTRSYVHMAIPKTRHKNRNPSARFEARKLRRYVSSTSCVCNLAIGARSLIGFEDECAILDRLSSPRDEQMGVDSLVRWPLFIVRVLLSQADTRLLSGAGD